MSEKEGKLTLCSMSAMTSFVLAIALRVASLSSGECIVASSTSLFCSFNLVLDMAASISFTASSRSSWLTSFEAAPAAAPSSSPCEVTEANSRASDSLKCASATISESSGRSSCLYFSDSRASTIAFG